MILKRSRICVSIAEGSADGFRKALARLRGAGIEMAEIRLDALDMRGQEAEDGIKGIFAGKGPLSLIATCRPANDNGGADPAGACPRKRILVSALVAGADFVDVELDAPEGLKDAVMEKAHSLGARTILSHHDFTGTPSESELKEIKLRCFRDGADIAKIACLAASEEDCVRLVAISDTETVVMGMGALGQRTRIFSPAYGSPFAFACIEPGKETAPGQIDYLALQRAWRIIGAR